MLVRFFWRVVGVGLVLGSCLGCVGFISGYFVYSLYRIGFLGIILRLGVYYLSNLVVCEF